MSKKQETRGTKSQSQRQKFIETARELGCEENEKAFDEALKKVAKGKHPEQSRKEIKQS